MQIRHSLVFNFLVIENLIRQTVESVMQPAGLHSSQVLVLEVLWETDGISQADIAKRLNVSPPTVNKMVKSLENSGFIKSDTFKFDRRAVRIKLTKKGREIRPEIYESWQNLENNLLGDLTDTEKILLTMQIEKLKNKLFESKM